MASMRGLVRRTRTAVDVLMHGSHGLTQPLETQVVGLTAHVADLRAEVDVLNTMHRRLDDVTAEIAALAGPAGRLVATGSPWWALLPFTTHRIRLGQDSFTADSGVEPDRDLRMRLITECADGNLSGKRVLDLGCLEGGFATECARRGAATVVAVEARPLSIRRCELVRDLLSLDNLELICGDVMHELARRQESFDVVLATGILYHLAKPDVALRLIRERCRGHAVICTHVAASDAPSHGCSDELVEYVGETGASYTGRRYSEADATTWAAAVSVGEGEQDLWAAWSNEASFWPVEEDLRRMITDAGFRSAERVRPGDFTEPWQVDQHHRVMYVCSV